MSTYRAIDRFRASILKDGLARPTKYEVRIAPPTALFAKNGPLDGTLTEAFVRNVGIACNSIIMPGRDLTGVSVKQGQDLAREQVGAHTYEGTITATFYLDPNLDYKTYFEAWQNLAVSSSTNNVNYYDNYYGSMSIHQLGSIPVTETTITLEQDTSGGSGDHRTSVNKHGFVEEKIHTHESIRKYGIQVEEVYPATVGQIEYAYATVDEVALLPVEFQYRRWQTIKPGSE